MPGRGQNARRLAQLAQARAPSPPTPAWPRNEGIAPLYFRTACPGRGGSLVADSSGDLVVETYKLTKIYQNRQIALNDVTLKLEPGCVLGLLGHNGAGKTTLLRLVLGLHLPTAGWVKVFGAKMTPNSAELRRRIGYIPTNPQFPRGMTPISYLDYIARLFGLPAEVRKPRLASLIRAVDLLEVSGQPIAGFSNGMTARLAVGTSLINEPELLR